MLDNTKRAKAITPAVVDAIYAMDNDELNAVITLVNARRQMLNARASMQFRVGDRVSFNCQDGYSISGTITRFVRGRSGKVDLSNCSDGRRWRVSAALLHSAK